MTTVTYQSVMLYLLFEYFRVVFKGLITCHNDLFKYLLKGNVTEGAGGQHTE